MTPLEAFLIAAVTGLGAFTAFLVRWQMAHLESDLAYSRKSNERGTSLAEKGATLAEQKASDG